MFNMKCFNKKYLTVLLFLVGCILVLFPAKTLNASTKKYDEQLQPDEYYYIDLNSDSAKERIYWDYSEEDEDKYGRIIIKLWINGKLVINENKEGYSANVSVIDVNEKDNVKEIIVQSNLGDGYMTDMRIYQFQNNKLNTAYAYSRKFGQRLVLTKGNAFTYGNGTLYWEEGAVSDLQKYAKMIDVTNCLGGVKNIPLQLSNGSFRVKNTQKFTLSYQKAKTLKKIKLYSKASTKSKVKGKIKKGSKIKVYKIKITGKGKGYVYVKTSSGKKGWIYLKPGVGKVLIDR